MKIAIGNDHRGFSLKSKLIGMLNGMGHETIDVGSDSTGKSVDYPDYAAAACRLVTHGDADRAILVCGTGIGMAITANKFRGIRAATCHDELTAEMCRRHNDVNVLCLSGDMLGERAIDGMVEIWLKTEFEGGRHARRIGKISDIEQSE
jgi:ribose 5-phosphate isomerase B